MATRQFTHAEMAELISEIVKAPVHVFYMIATDSYFARWAKDGESHELEFHANDSYLPPWEFQAARSEQLKHGVNVASPQKTSQINANSQS